MTRFLLPLNLAMGTLFLLIAVIHPLYQEHFAHAELKGIAEGVVDKLVNQQMQHYSATRRFLTFTPADMPRDLQEKVGIRNPSAHAFTYEAVTAGDGRLTIRARTAEWLLLQAKAPLMTYVAVIDLRRNDLQRAWRSDP